MIALPTCRHRGEETDPAGWCACDSTKLLKFAKKSKPSVPVEFCLKCPYVDHEYQAEPPRGRIELAPRQDRSLPCIHRGQLTGERIDCKTCSGHVSLLVLACKIHGSCTMAKAVPDKACCAVCGDYQP